MSTPLWHEYRATIARELKNNDEGDELWRGLSRLFATIGAVLEVYPVPEHQSSVSGAGRQTECIKGHHPASDASALQGAEP
jgi:hypothetical protein